MRVATLSLIYIALMWLLWYTLMLFFLWMVGKVAGFPLIQHQHMTDFSSTSIISSVNAHVCLQYNFRLGCRGIVNTVCAVSVYRLVCTSIPSIVQLPIIPPSAHSHLWGCMGEVVPGHYQRAQGFLEGH